MSPVGDPAAVFGGNHVRVRTADRSPHEARQNSPRLDRCLPWIPLSRDTSKLPRFSQQPTWIPREFSNWITF